jgi:hypothetical protein
MSPSVSPIPFALFGESENGSKLARIVADEVVTGTPVVMPVYRAESTVALACLAVMTMRVE